MCVYKNESISYTDIALNIPPAPKKYNNIFIFRIVLERNAFRTVVITILS